MQLPDRWNPRLWLRSLYLALKRWMMKRTPSEQIADRADAVRMAEAFGRAWMTREEIRQLDNTPVKSTDASEGAS